MKSINDIRVLIEAHAKDGPLEKEIKSAFENLEIDPANPEFYLDLGISLYHLRLMGAKIIDIDYSLELIKKSEELIQKKYPGKFQISNLKENDVPILSAAFVFLAEIYLEKALSELKFRDRGNAYAFLSYAETNIRNYLLSRLAKDNIKLETSNLDEYFDRIGDTRSKDQYRKIKEIRESLDNR